MNKRDVEERVRGVAAILEIEHLLKKRPRSLSGGERQRVAIGRAIVREPGAFLLDEPMSNLDVRLRAQMRGEIARIQRRVGVTTLYVTHDQTEAMTLGDRVGVLRDGVLQQVAAPRDLYRNPSNLFVAGFVGSPPMNLAEGTVEEGDEGVFVRFGGHRVRAGGAHAPALHPYAGRQVVVGLRPEDLVDPSASGLLPDTCMRVVVERRETVGPDVYLHFTVEAPLLLAEDPRDPDEDGAARSWPLERPNLWLARAGSSAAQPGDRIELGVRSEGLRLFDPRTGRLVVA